MEQYTLVEIGVQARSTSERLPGKVFEKIGDRMLLQHVIDACMKSNRYMNQRTQKTKVFCQTSLLIPTGDEIAKRFSGKVKMFEGSEADVLGRYAGLLKESGAHYVVRVTGDCPLIPDLIITTMINKAIMNQYDYYSNVIDPVRTAPDGWDCEVMSARCLDWLDKNVTSARLREHVTLYIRETGKGFPGMKIAPAMGCIDLSSLKISVDTKEDLEKVREEYKKINEKHSLAVSMFGKQNVHRFEHV